MEQRDLERLKKWHVVNGPEGSFRERFTEEALHDAIWNTTWPLCFRVIREEWDDSGEMPERVIHEVEWVSSSGA